MADELTCFKAYDVRGRVPDEINEEIAGRIGRAYATYLRPKRVVVGHDIRLSSKAITDALVDALCVSGVDVLEIGQCGTEEIYFATSHYELDGGIVVTASHNPRDYNGMKFVREQSKPISGDTGLKQIRQIAESRQFYQSDTTGRRQPLNHRDDYIQHLFGYIDGSGCRPLKIVVNSGNGGAGAVVDLLARQLPFEFIRLQHEADGSFPNGVPNPLVQENRSVTSAAVKANGADMGIAWDGDFDRCFFFDENGEFVEGYYIVGLLAETFLEKVPGSTIIHDPRLTWNTIDIAARLGGRAVQSKTGHAFIKERMRLEDAIYGGEMSAHHYFRDFAYCDSGMIPWLLVAELMSKKGVTLSQLVADRAAKFPASGEINRRVQDPDALLATVRSMYQASVISIDTTDGLGMEFPRWRFNLRMSNTEPVVRLNVESRADPSLMQERTDELLDLIGGEGV